MKKVISLLLILVILLTFSVYSSADDNSSNLVSNFIKEAEEYAKKQEQDGSNPWSPPYFSLINGVSALYYAPSNWYIMTIDSTREELEEQGLDSNSINRFEALLQNDPTVVFNTASPDKMKEIVAHFYGLNYSEVDALIDETEEEINALMDSYKAEVEGTDFSIRSISPVVYEYTNRQVKFIKIHYTISNSTTEVIFYFTSIPKGYFQIYCYKDDGAIDEEYMNLCDNFVQKLDIYY